MDDIDTKVRRNLVVFSAAICIGWFLDIKHPVISGFFISASGLEFGNATKFWIVVFLVLLYLFQRYWFTTDASQISSFLIEEYNSLRHTYLAKYLQQKASRYVRTGRHGPYSEASLQEFIDQQKNYYKGQGVGDEFSLRDLLITLPLPDENPARVVYKEHSVSRTWNGRVTTTYTFQRNSEPSNYSSVSGGHALDYAIPLPGRLWISSCAFARAAFFSKSSIEFLIPIILAVFAGLISICNFFLSFRNLPA